MNVRSVLTNVKTIVTRYYRIKISPSLVSAALAALLAVGGLGLTGTALAADVDFAYSGDIGPAFWADLKQPDWDACRGAGGMQSPIDITDVIVEPSLEPLDLDLYEAEIDLINNGHTIEQHYTGTGSTLYLDGFEYELTQFHFHTLSEHAVGGQRGAMELHAVFQEPNSGDHAVVGMIYRIGGNENAFLAELAAHGLPEKKGETVTSNDEINLADGLTETSSYYRYAGSLTTPPCSENVTWLVLKTQAEMSKEQFRDFRDILGNDFRPLQDAQGRTIYSTARRGKGEAH